MKRFTSVQCACVCNGRFSFRCADLLWPINPRGGAAQAERVGPQVPPPMRTTTTALTTPPHQTQRQGRRQSHHQQPPTMRLWARPSTRTRTISGPVSWTLRGPWRGRPSLLLASNTAVNLCVRNRLHVTEKNEQLPGNSRLCQLTNSTPSCSSLSSLSSALSPSCHPRRSPPHPPPAPSPRRNRRG